MTLRRLPTLPPVRPARLPLLIALALPGIAAAQTAAQQQPIQLSEIVVTASGFEQELRQAPASISVVTREELETRQFRDLAEALQEVEGIDVRGGTGKTGGLDISIRGMPSDYTLVLIDGRRQNVAGDITPNGFGAALTSFMPPLSAIERIEIIRGPMSTLYGSDAMGGVVNIITRKVSPEWGGSATVQVGVPQHGNEGGQRRFNVYLDGPIVQDLLGISVRGDVYRRSASERIWSEGNARDPRPGESRQHTIGTKLTLTPNRDHEVWLDAEQGRTWYDNSDCRLGGVDYRNCATGTTAVAVPGYRDYMRVNRDQVALGHSSRLGIGLLESSVMYSVTETLGRTIPTAARPAGDPAIGTDRTLETKNTVFDTKLVTPLGDSHLLTTGAQWWDARFEDGLLPDRHKQTMWALFAEDEWSLTDSLTATFGGRYNHHDAFGGEFSPRAYLVWEATENWTAKGGVSRGFRAPRLNQLIDGVSGITGQGSTISIGNPNLQPEISTSTEFGVLYDSLAGVSGSATLFHNRVKNRIGTGGDCAVSWISSCSANPGATYAVNIDEGKTWGLELSSRIALAQRWSLNLNYTWTDSEAIENGVKTGKLSDTAEHIANAQLRWQTTDRLSLWVTGEYRGKSRRFDGDPGSLTGNNRLEYEALGDLKAYALFHLGGSYKVSDKVTLNANVYNLLDKDFDRLRTWTDTTGQTVVGSVYYKTSQATKGTAPYGRTFWLSANINF